MKKILCFALLTFSLSFFCLGQGVIPTPDCNKDVKDSRGKMKPWEKGAHETGKYRNEATLLKETIFRQKDSSTPSQRVNDPSPIGKFGSPSDDFLPFSEGYSL